MLGCIFSMCEGKLQWQIVQMLVIEITSLCSFVLWTLSFYNSCTKNLVFVC
jgi:hypothetical protein